jgi:hypothetical protein
LFFTTLLLGGCASKYIAPSSGDQANITFSAPASDMFGIAQTTSLVPSEKCENQQMMAVFSMLKTDRTASQAVAAGQRLYFRVGMSNTRAYPLMRWCTNLVNFIPQPGAIYSLKHKYVGETCSVELLQQSDSKPPPSLQTHNAKACI